MIGCTDLVEKNAKKLSILTQGSVSKWIIPCPIVVIRC